MNDEDFDGGCCHFPGDPISAGGCAYCSGKWRREQTELHNEQMRIAALANGKRDLANNVGVIHRRGWTRGVGA